MKYRYKIIEIERSGSDLLPAKPRIIFTTATISGLLLDEINKSPSGAEVFAVESASLAWFEFSNFVVLIIREDDPGFNLDLFLGPPANLTERNSKASHGSFEKRLTRRSIQWDKEMGTHGLSPTSCGPLPYASMRGRIYQTKGGEKTVFGAPAFPKLTGGPGDPDFEGLKDAWFRKMQEILSVIGARTQGALEVFFEAGGGVEIPSWFLDWCKEQGVTLRLSECNHGNSEIDATDTGEIPEGFDDKSLKISNRIISEAMGDMDKLMARLKRP